MTALRRVTRKLRGRSVDELRVRGTQALAAWRERAGLAVGALSTEPDALARRLAASVPTDAAALLGRRRSAASTRFFGAFDDPAATVAALRAASPATERDVLARAARIRADRFDLLGYEGLDFGTPIDWHRDPVRDRRAPGVHWSRVPYLDAAIVGDHKVTWEINRQQYLATLGQAYWLTGDAAHAATFADHVRGWMDANPPKQGMNWASSLEVAFRAISWVWALEYFRDADALTPGLYARLLNHLHVHAEHLATYLSTYFSPNTHLTGEALGLVYVGGLVPELAGATRWRQAGLDVLNAWLPRQVRPDGTYFEQATQYHRYTTEFCLHLLLLAERNGWGLRFDARALLRALGTHVRALARADGTIPLLGDDDGGRFVPLDPAPPDDVRGLQHTLATVLDAPDLRTFGTPDVAMATWLLGPAGSEVAAQPTRGRGRHAGSEAFQDGGFYVLRDASAGREWHGVVDCGPHGVMNCGHAHADALAFVCSVGGQHLLVDAGTFTYPAVERNAYRGAAAHNVVLVDGQGASEPAAGAFQWSHRTDARCRRWIARPELTLCVGAHDGFRRLPDPVGYERGVLLLPGTAWVVVDRLDAAEEHELEARWHLAPGLEVASADGGALVVRTVAGGDVIAHVHAFGAPRLSTVTAREGVSPRYGAEVAGTVATFRQRGRAAQTLLMCLLPAAADGTLPRVQGTASPGGAWLLAFGPADDGGPPHGMLVVGAPAGGHAEIALDGAPAVATDGEWAWVAWSADRSTARATLVAGQYLRVGADTILEGPRTGALASSAGVRTASWREGVWREDTPALGAGSDAP